MAIGALIVSGDPSADQRPRYSSKVEAVRLDVLVTRNGRPVNGLGKDDFEVYDSGVRQEVGFVSFEQLPLNVVLALDVSDSVKGERLGHLQDASRAFVRALEAQDQAALLAFNHRVALAAPMTSDRRQITEAIDRLPSGGGTALIHAIHASIILGEGIPGRALSVVFTDGEDTASYLTAKAVLDVAKRTGVVVYGVALTSAGRARSLRAIAEQTGGSLVSAGSSADLRDVFVGILDEFRRRYLLSYTPTGGSRSGWHSLEVRVKDRALRVRSRPGYQVN